MPAATLPEIPVLDVAGHFAVESLNMECARAHALLDSASGHIPRAALHIADAISRRWLERWDNPYLDEISQVSARLNRPGAFFFSVHYEWGCTTAALPAPDSAGMRLVRVLDWRTHGLGRNIVAARIASPFGRWTSLTWPGYTGTLQAMAPGRFSAALNQAPMTMSTPLMPADWALNRARVWNRGFATPAHVLRQVFEIAPDYSTARQQLMETPLCTPAIFTIAGTRYGEGCVIERRETEARVRELPAVSANEWFSSDDRQSDRSGQQDWRGRPRGENNPQRCELMGRVRPELDGSFPWLRAPVLNPTTRLVMVADAREGRLVAQGFEADGRATEVLSLDAKDLPVRSHGRAA